MEEKTNINDNSKLLRYYKELARLSEKFWTDRIEIRAFYLDKFNDKNDVTI